MSYRRPSPARTQGLMSLNGTVALRRHKPVPAFLNPVFGGEMHRHGAFTHPKCVRKSVRNVRFALNATVPFCDIHNLALPATGICHLCED